VATNFEEKNSEGTKYGPTVELTVACSNVIKCSLEV